MITETAVLSNSQGAVWPKEDTCKKCSTFQGTVLKSLFNFFKRAETSSQNFFARKPHVVASPQFETAAVRRRTPEFSSARFNA